MPPTRRTASNGRSPLASKKGQITAFFNPVPVNNSDTDSSPCLPKEKLKTSSLSSPIPQSATESQKKIKCVDEEEEGAGTIRVRKLKRLRRMNEVVNADADAVQDAEDLEDYTEADDDTALKEPSSSKGKRKMQVDDDDLESCKISSLIGEKSMQVQSTTAKREENGVSGNFSQSFSCTVPERFTLRERERYKFLQEGYKDAGGKRPGDEGYDPRTIYLPHDFLKSLSGGQRQWWEFKSKHMDKVLFFKMGKFYEMFEMDAHVGVKELDLQYMKGEQPHCGFPEKNLSMNLEKLARKGYRVLVVEQTETPDQLEVRRKQNGTKDKVVKREICAVVTKGTLTEVDSLLTNPDSSYIISITEQCDNKNNESTVIGICVIDVSTSMFTIGQLEEDEERHGLRTILSELRPVEIIKPADLLSLKTEKILKSYTRNPLINNLIPSCEFWDAERTIDEMKNIYHIPPCSASEQPASDKLKFPDVLSEFLSAGHNGYLALSAFGGCLFYLRQAFLDTPLLKCARFEKLCCTGSLRNSQTTYMVLNAAALENLEILENNINGGTSGSLFGQLDHCVTPFSRRLLKTWLVRPLYDKSSIVERQDAIAVFKGYGFESAMEFRKEIVMLPDMERLLTRLFIGSELTGRNAIKVIHYEDAAKKKIQEFIAALRGCRLMYKACFSLYPLLTSTSSSLLHRLLTPGKGLPEISSVLKHFEDAFDWTEADCNGRIVPQEGCDIEYDDACTKLKEIELCLESYLKEQRKIIGDSSITYVTVGKDSYLLEVPESLSSSVPPEYELCLSKKGFFRYRTPRLRKYLSELALAEADKESALRALFLRLLVHFTEHRHKWRQLVSLTAELDVLISLSVSGDYFDGPSCRPVVTDVSNSSDKKVPFISGKRLGHPLLHTKHLKKGSFVSNDVHIGGAEHPKFIILTGPNMGGKSTLLRQVLLAVILAQIGADVPAEKFEFSPVDRIYVRMGARDHIMAGQSTFLVELSETASILRYATENSLVALDELGRGTSTSDGHAIAASVLDYLVNNVQCRGLFSTHYHEIAVEFENNTKASLFHMACEIREGIRGMEHVSFLYKLTPGSCPKSYGVNVARLAGIPRSVLEKAVEKSNEFELNGRHKGVSAFLRGLLKAIKTFEREEVPEETVKSVLQDFQQRARWLLLQYAVGSRQ